MSRKHAFFVMLVASLLVLSSVAIAQTTDVAPDAYVKGTGVVQFSNTNYAEFNINVSQAGSAFFGGFKWAEYALSATTTNVVVRPIVVISKQITGMQFLADNHVKVTAVGYYMDKPANITFEALDDLNMDWVKITVDTIVPAGSLMPTFHYERAGGVSKGSVVIYRKPTGRTIANGNGAIAVKRNIGAFSFRFTSAAAGTGGTGSLIYQEINPLVMSPIVKPIVSITMTKVTLMQVTGAKAYIEGFGVLNNLPAKVTLTAIDNAKPGPIVVGLPLVPDFFVITAVPTVPTFVAADYSAGGSLIRGDIFVGPAGVAVPL